MHIYIYMSRALCILFVCNISLLYSLYFFNVYMQCVIITLQWVVSRCRKISFVPICFDWLYAPCRLICTVYLSLCVLKYVCANVLMCKPKPLCSNSLKSLFTNACVVCYNVRACNKSMFSDVCVYQRLSSVHTKLFV